MISDLCFLLAIVRLVDGFDNNTETSVKILSRFTNKQILTIIGVVLFTYLVGYLLIIMSQYSGLFDDNSPAKLTYSIYTNESSQNRPTTSRRKRHLAHRPNEESAVK